jgi:DNA-binding NarL/FixJ family response regulator
LAVTTERLIRVLVVDDDKKFAMAVTAFIEAEGFEVIGPAANGLIATGFAEAFRIDVVTMDLDMPVMGGIEATRRLHERYPNLPIIIVTGSESSGRIAEAIRAGAVANVAKSRVLHDLIPAIRAALGTT